MASYEYKCIQGECEKCNQSVEINKPMSESSREEFCEECKHPLDRIYTSFAMKSADGFKS